MYTLITEVTDINEQFIFRAQCYCGMFSAAAVVVSDIIINRTFSQVTAAGVLLLLTLFLCRIFETKIEHYKRFSVITLIIQNNLLIPLLLLWGKSYYMIIPWVIVGYICAMLVLDNKVSILFALATAVEDVLIILLYRFDGRFSPDRLEGLVSTIIVVSIGCAITYYVKGFYLSRIENMLTENRYLELNNMELKNTSFTDKLTGLYNRGYYDSALQKSMNYALHRNAPVSLIMLDIDHFKVINDTYGHEAGDAALKELARTIRVNTRENDICCRYGGEEFCIILYADTDVAAERAEKLRKAVEELELDVIGHMTISLGVAPYSKGYTAEEFFSAADKMTYLAKNSGRNQVRVAR